MTGLCESMRVERRVEQIRTGDASRVLRPMSEKTRRDACGKAKAETIIGRAEICRLPFFPIYAAIVSSSAEDISSSLTRVPAHFRSNVKKLKRQDLKHMRNYAVRLSRFAYADNR